MKTIIYLLLIFLTISQSKAQPGWNFQNPYPTRSDIYSVKFHSPDAWYIMGNAEDHNLSLSVDSNGPILEKTLSGETVGVKNVSAEVPKKFSLSQNYSNPFNPKTIINYQLRITNLVKLTIYDELGNKVAVLVNEFQSPGSYVVEFNGSNYSSGVYFYRLVVSLSNPMTSGDFSETKRMMLIK